MSVAEHLDNDVAYVKMVTFHEDRWEKKRC